MTSPQRRTVFQVSHSVSASSAPYRLNDALNRNISDMESVLLLRRRKGIDGLEISRSAARRATDALRRHLVTAQDSCDMRDRLLRYFATCGQEKPLSGSLKRGEKNA